MSIFLVALVYWYLPAYAAVTAFNYFVEGRITVQSILANMLWALGGWAMIFVSLIIVVNETGLEKIVVVERKKNNYK